MRRGVLFQTVRDVLLTAAGAAAILAWVAVAATVRAPSAAPPRINGAYELKGSGPGVVSGRAVVTPMRVRIDATLVDVDGNEVPVVATNLAIDGSTYRFRGAGTVGPATATIAGRLDPDDKTLKKCRIVGTVLSADGKAGRFTGEHR